MDLVDEVRKIVKRKSVNSNRTSCREKKIEEISRKGWGVQKGEQSLWVLRKKRNMDYTAESHNLSTMDVSNGLRGQDTGYL